MYNFGIVSDIAEVIGETFAFLGLICSISSFISVALFILNGLGIYNMSKKMELKSPWISFIPVANIFALGRIAQRYVKRDGTPSAKFGITLVILYVSQFLVSVAFIIFSVIATISVISNAELAIEQEVMMEMSMFSSLIPVIILYFVLAGVALTYKIIYYVSLWRVFSIFSNENATLFTVLSVFFSFLAPIFLFVIRNNQPKLTYNERIGLPDNYFEVNVEEEKQESM